MKLALLTLALGAANAVHVTFKRYSQPGCEEMYRIHSDTHLDDPHCKTFSSHEVPFMAFKMEPEDGKEDIVDSYNKLCRATVFEMEDCQGEGKDFGDMKYDLNQCRGHALNGRSVMITCQDRAQTITVTSSPVPETTTLMLVPSYPASHCDRCD